MAGWIKTHRAIQDHWIFSDAEKYRAWMIILFTVNFEPKKQMIEGEIVQCKRGQSTLSLNSWSDKFGRKWSIQKVRTFFNLLKKDKMITTEGLRKTTRLTVCNYESYQDEQQAGNKQVTERQQAGNKQVTTTKEGKEREEGKEGKEYNTPSIDEGKFYLTSKKKKLTGKRLESFNIFWDKFNYKTGKAEAAQSWFEIPELTDSLCCTIYKSAELECEKRPKLQEQNKTPKMAQGWLSSRRWEDEADTKQIQKVNFGL